MDHNLDKISKSTLAKFILSGVLYLMKTNEDGSITEAEQSLVISEDQHNRIVQSLLEDYRYSTSKFDGLSVAISGGALAFSLTFVTDIVPFHNSRHIWLLYLALGLFIVSIITGFLAHLLVMRNLRNMLAEVSSKKYDLLFKAIKDRFIHTLNWLIAGEVSIGVISLVLYCTINIQSLRDEQNENYMESSIPNRLFMKATESADTLTNAADTSIYKHFKKQ